MEAKIQSERDRILTAQEEMQRLKKLNSLEDRKAMHEYEAVLITKLKEQMEKIKGLTNESSDLYHIQDKVKKAEER